MNNEIKKYIDNTTFKVEKNIEGRFFDQKCTPDVVCAIAECVLEYTKDDVTLCFTKDDIWHFDYTNSLITESFSKPNLDEDGSKSEYDKFFAHPLEMLAFAGILSRAKIKGRNFYTVVKRDFLEYISARERNALDFIDAYLVKLLNDNGLMKVFEVFFEKQDKTSFLSLRATLKSFIYSHTRIENDKEPSRIFNKMINVICYKRHLKGSTRGHLSKNAITLNEIRYNNTNWRDIDKSKSMSRKDYYALINSEINKDSGFYKYQIEKAKQFVKKIEKFSEIHRFENYPASQAHHIFMASEFPEIADCPENIICITPNQHYTFAHLDGNTQMVDKDYQIVCLLCKLDSIEINFRQGKDDYSLPDFVNVLNVGLGTDFFKPQMNFEEIKFNIMKKSYYHN